MVLDNESVTGDALANKINDFFTFSTNEVTPLQPEPSKNQFEFNECYIEPQFIIDEEREFDKLSNVSISKSLGSEGIPNWLLKDYAVLAMPVVSLFNVSIQQQHVPTVWKKRKIFQFPKHDYLQISQLLSVLFH